MTDQIKSWEEREELRLAAVTPMLSRLKWPYVSLSPPEQEAARDAHRRLMGLDRPHCPSCTCSTAGTIDPQDTTQR